jgi:hypothetical protein
MEEFEGFVDLIDGDTAHVTLKAKDGENFWAEIPTSDLVDRGIHEHRRFKCMVIDTGMELIAIPDREIDDKLISERIEKLLGDDPQNDY